MALEDKYMKEKISNIKTTIIEISEDKLLLILREEYPKLRYAKIAWSLVSFTLTIMLTLLTSNCKSVWLFSGGQVQVFFIICAVLSLLFAIVLFVMSYGHGVKSIVCKIKDEEAK